MGRTRWRGGLIWALIPSAWRIREATWTRCAWRGARGGRLLLVLTGAAVAQATDVQPAVGHRLYFMMRARAKSGHHGDSKDKQDR